MASVRVEALRALAAIIEQAVPELVGKVKAGQAPSGVEQTYPTLTLMPGTMKYEPHQEGEHATIGEPSEGNVVFNVGAHAGPLQMRLMTTSIGERWELEEKVLNVFLSQELRPGVLVVPVTSIAALSSWVAAYELESDGWQDAFAFDRKLESLIVVNAIIPALVARTGVYEIDDLVLQLEASKHLDLDAEPIAGDVEQVVISEDGGISPYVPPS